MIDTTIVLLSASVVIAVNYLLNEDTPLSFIDYYLSIGTPEKWRFLLKPLYQCMPCMTPYYTAVVCLLAGASLANIIPTFALIVLLNKYFDR
jgi:hypothetical protein